MIPFEPPIALRLKPSPHCGGRNSHFPRIASVLIPGTFRYVISRGKKDSADRMTLRIWSWGGHPEGSAESRGAPRGGEGEGQRRRCKDGSKGVQACLCGQGAASKGCGRSLRETNKEFFPSLADIP